MKKSKISVINIFINKKGYSSVFLAICLVAFSVSLVTAIWICRAVVVRSECESYGRVWARAVLSEYDVHLMEDYGIMAYFGGESDVKKKIDSFMNYSLKGKMTARLGGSQSELAGYELGDPENFRKAITKNLPYEAAEMTAQLASGRDIRSDASEDDADEENDGKLRDRKIGNRVVLDTLPSRGRASYYDDSDIKRMSDKIRNLGCADAVRSMISESGAEFVFIEQYFSNHVTKARGKAGYLENEWEYIICGHPSDKRNLIECRINLIVLREGLNLISLLLDKDKVKLIADVTKASNLAAPVVAIVLPVAWAGLETVFDMRDLYKGKRVPIVKTDKQWKTDLGAVLKSDKFKKEAGSKMSKEQKESMEENSKEIQEAAEESLPAPDINIPFKDGLNYDEYLLYFIAMMSESERTLRMMDLVQINMKSRYYKDFNMMEYYTGVRYVMEVNGRDYAFEDAYN